MVEQVREQPKESVRDAAKHSVDLAKDFTNESLPRKNADGVKSITFHAPSIGATMFENWGLGATSGEIAANDKGNVSGSVGHQSILIDGPQEKSKK